MNLLSIIFNELSQYEFKDFFSFTGSQLPINLLEKLIKQNSYTVLQNKELLEIINYLKIFNTSSKFWRNPEIFPLIMSLFVPTSSIKVGQEISDLKMHLGLIPDVVSQEKKEKYYRFNHLHDCVILHKNAVSRVITKDKIFFRHDETNTVVYYPTKGLFNDLLPKELYPNLIHKYNKSFLAKLVNDSLTILKNYSLDIWKDFQDVISNIILTPDYKRPLRWSYNCRLSYFGGIFINPFRVNIYSMAESIIHEYYHQRMWQWWAFEDLDCFRDLEQHSITSPFTGEVKSASVMTHALMIYTSTIHFYSYILSNDITETTAHKNWVNNRFEFLRCNIESLYLSLKKISYINRINTKFFDYIMEEFYGFSI